MGDKLDIDEEKLQRWMQNKWANLKENIKDPYFFVKIWQQMTILGFLVGIFLGAMLTQNYYINQVNEVFDQAREQDGCFNSFYSEQFNASLWDVHNISSVPIDGVEYDPGKPHK